MKLPPSIIERKILCELPNNYGAYLYRFIDTLHPAKAPYIGIKKDKLPEDGGEIYWSSSTNEEFKRLVQGDEPRFTLEILEVTTKDNFDSLRLKEYQILKEYPNIKNNPDIYNLSYGIPPYPNTDNSMLSDEFLEWYHSMKESGEWTSKVKEPLSVLVDIPTAQIRSVDNLSFINELAVELQENGNNTSKMNPVLIFEGVGKKFGFDTDCDVVVGTRHGLEAAKKVGSIDMHTIRVPYKALKDKTEFFLRSLASNDNFDDSPLKNIASVEDGAKLLVSLYNEHGIEPNNKVARDYLDRVYGFRTKKKSNTIKQAETDIAMQKLVNSKWKIYSKKEFDDIEEVNSNDNEIHMCISSGMFNIFSIYKRFQDDVKERRKMIIWVAHPNTAQEKRWMGNFAGFEEILKFINEDKFDIKFQILPSIVPDTENYAK
mgnify:FL=1